MVALTDTIRLSVATGLAIFLLSSGEVSGDDWGFVDATLSAGFDYSHGFVEGGPGSLGVLFMSGGVAVGDFDRDGWQDLYVVRGTIGRNLLFKNGGDGTFEDVAAAAGVDIDAAKGNGPVFVDLDGDGWSDLFIGGMESTPIEIFRNLGNSTFESVTIASGLPTLELTFGASFGDYDGDGDLDAFVPQWNAAPSELLFRNNGDFTFTGVTSEAFTPDAHDDLLFTFTTNFTDLDGDGHQDLLVTSDFDNSRVFLNTGAASFLDVSDNDILIDRNGMGAAVADYDRDGVLDWFVTAIRVPGQEIPGNRLYRGVGDGSFLDTTEIAGVAEGHWGWGACFADFDNDGWPDIFHVNGYVHEPVNEDPSRLFVNGGDGTFSEESMARGIDDRGQGRGVVCFDYDRDGDLDIFVANNSEPPRLFRNLGVDGNHFVSVSLRGSSPNSAGIGAQVVFERGAVRQVDQVRAGNNYVSHNPALVHFGLGADDSPGRLIVHWPSGVTTSRAHVAADQELIVFESEVFFDGFESGSLESWSSVQLD